MDGSTVLNSIHLISVQLQLNSIQYDSKGHLQQIMKCVITFSQDGALFGSFNYEKVVQEGMYVLLIYQYRF